MPFFQQKVPMRKEFPMKIRSNNQMRTVLAVSLQRFEVTETEFEKVFTTYHLEFYFQAMEDGFSTRISGGGRKPILQTAREKLSFCLYYLKAYPKFEDLANRFDMSIAAAHNNIHRLLPLLQQTLQNLGVMPAREFSGDEEMRAFLKKRN